MKQLTDLERLLFIALDGVGDAEGSIFDYCWDMTKQELEEVLTLYNEWNNQFHLIARAYDENNTLIRFDINRINPEDFYNQLLPGKWVITCTEKDYLINTKLKKVEGYGSTYIKE